MSDCGCKTEWVGQDMTIPSVASVRYCPLHDAAPKMLKALKWAHDRIHPPQSDGRPSCGYTCPARAAIHAAKEAPK